MDNGLILKMSQIELPKYLSPFKYQIAGHSPATTAGCTGFLLHEKEDVVWKPYQSASRGVTETLFYEIVWLNEYDDSNELAPYVQFLRMVTPRFYGLASFGENPELKYLQLENILYGYHHPCVMDVKIGRQTWPPTSTKERVAYEQEKYPCLREMGFRFLGMSVYDPLKQRRFVRDKQWGKVVQPENIWDVFQMFFSGVGDNSLPVVQLVADRIDALQAWFSHQDKFFFFTTSILIVYEAGLAHASDVKADAKMIDFTHVYPSDEGMKDDNFLYGLNKFLTSLKSYCRALSVLRKE